VFVGVTRSTPRFRAATRIPPRLRVSVVNR